MLKIIICAGLGGFVGTVMRALLTMTIPTQNKFMITLLINISGSFLLGILAGLQANDNSVMNHPLWKAFLMIGICGGFTTFSAFSLENIRLLQDGKIFIALSYIAISLIVGIFATYLGIKLTA